MGQMFDSLDCSSAIEMPGMAWHGGQTEEPTVEDQTTRYVGYHNNIIMYDCTYLTCLSPVGMRASEHSR